MGSEASDVPRHEASITLRSEDQVWHRGYLRPSGVYTEPDSIVRHVLKSRTHV